MSTERPSFASIWLAAARPRTLGAAFAPVFVGACLAWADGVFRLPVVLACLFGAVAIQLATNFANDYFDFIKGADTAERLGPVRATAAGWVTPEQMRMAIVVAFAALMPSALYLVAVAGWPLVLIGVVSMVCALAYTGGPYPLAYVGLGDVFVVVFFGPVAVGGTYYAQALSITPLALVAGLMPGLIATALLAVNNLRDVDTDRVARKHTLAVRFGETFAKLEIAVCLAVPVVILPVALVAATGEHLGALISLLAAIPAVRIIQRAWTETGRALIPVLENIGKVLVLHSTLFGLGWALT